jgi:endonuclease/exonuclease/phosphatase family metal-dependent hydrolase
MASFFLRTQGYINIHFYTLGSPRVGGQNFYNHMDKFFKNKGCFNVINLRYVLQKDKFFVEYDPVSKWPEKDGYVNNAYTYGIESGFLFKPVFEAYANQPDYMQGNLGGTRHNLLPIHDKCGIHWANLHTNMSASTKALMGKKVKVYLEKISFPLNAVINLNLWPCDEGIASIFFGGILEEPKPKATCMKERFGNFLIGCFTAPAAWGLKKLFRTKLKSKPILKNYDKNMIEEDRLLFRTLRRGIHRGWHCATIPNNTPYYKAMEVDNLDSTGSRDLSWYGPITSANKYSPYFGVVHAFITTKTLRLMELTNNKNIKKLIQEFDENEQTMGTDGKPLLSNTVWINGKERKINDRPSQLLKIATGYMMTCEDLEKFRRYFFEQFDYDGSYDYDPRICKQMMHPEVKQQRFSLHELDIMVFGNMCRLFEHFKVDIDGYIMRPMSSSWGVFINPENTLFPAEILLCKADVIKPNLNDPLDYRNRRRIFKAKRKIDKKDKNKSFIVLSMNVEYYQTGSMETIAKSIKESKADIVCIQEDLGWLENDKPQLNQFLLPDYVETRKCKGGDISGDLNQNGYIIKGKKHGGSGYKGKNGQTVYSNEGFLSNAIYVKKEIAPLVEYSNNFRLEESILDSRCVTIVRVGGIVIATTHLSGGRFDDEKFERNVNIKGNQLNEIIMKYRPDIICGDFNGEYTKAAALKTLSTYPLYQRLADGNVDDPNLSERKRRRLKRSTNKQSEYLEYAQGWGKVFKGTMFKPVYTETEIGPTSKFGGTPDWIFYNSRFLDAPNFGIVELINRGGGKPDISDHNGVWAQFITKS